MITHIFIQGMFSHFSFEAAPHIEVNHEISVNMWLDIQKRANLLFTKTSEIVKKCYKNVCRLKKKRQGKVACFDS